MKNRCSYCNKLLTMEEQVNGIVYAKEYVGYCFNCSEKIFEHIRDMELEETDDININFTPKVLYDELNKHVVSQEKVKKVLSIALYNHFKRINLDDEVKKSNVLLLGPTGTGKTLMLETIADFMDVPLVIANANQFTQSGYKGEELTSIFERLIVEAELCVNCAEKGIIYIDEVDKLANNVSDYNSSYVNQQSIQQELLKFIEKDEVTVEISRVPYTINTSNILFIFGGAFVGLEDIINKRLGIDKNKIGFKSDNIVSKNKSIDSSFSNVIPEDIIEYGFIPEFMGRIPIITDTKKLTVDDLMKILTDVETSIITEYRILLEVDNVELGFSKDALKCIANLAFNMKTGARGLRSILENVMQDIMFEVPSLEYKEKKKLFITKDMVLRCKKEKSLMESCY